MKTEFSDIELEKLKLENYLKRKLSIMYPDKIINRMHELDPSLYVNVFNKLRKIRELNSEEYAEFLGFGWKTKVDLRRENEKVTNDDDKIVGTYYSGKYDLNVLRKLYTEFNVKETTIANLLNIKRQYISVLIKDKKESSLSLSWVSDEINALEIEILNLMIEDMELTYDDEEITVLILKNKNMENAIFIKNPDRIKFIENVPEPFLSKFKVIGFDKYNETDIKIIKKFINEGHNKGDFIKVSGKEINVPPKMRIREYIEFLGFNYISTNSRTDKELLDILMKYKCGENEICFNTQCPEYHLVSVALNRRNTNLEEFVKVNNYKIVSDLDRSINAIRGYTEELNKRKIGIGNKVYLYSYDPLYSKLQSYVQNKGKSLDEFIAELNFERVLEVPEGCIKYDWTCEVDQHISDDVKVKILKTLNPFIVGDNFLYLPADSPEYAKLYDYFAKKALKLDDILKSWGIKKISLASAKEFKSIKKKLKEIENIQGNGDFILTTVEKLHRNNNLVKELKILYKYRCQICGEEFTDLLIDMGKGIYYVEGHHIKLLSTVKGITEEEEIKEIDSYKNVIIVCPYHHKYLHYHHGGFYHIFRDENNKLYFKNEIGETLEIKLNYHLL